MVLKNYSSLLPKMVSSGYVFSVLIALLQAVFRSK